MIEDTPHFNRRKLLAGAGALTLLGATGNLTRKAEAQATAYAIPEQFRPTIVPITPGFEVGTIHVYTNYFYLYWIMPDLKAVRYGVGVGEIGRQMRGNTVIRRKQEWPSWTPTANMIRRRPDLYREHAGGMPGGPGNPLGSRALYLFQGNRDTLYRIHGTHAPNTIGMSVSNGCIRLANSHVEDLYQRVPLGTRVFVHADEVKTQGEA